MITMKLRFVLAPAFLAMLVHLTAAELEIHPRGDMIVKEVGDFLFLTCVHSVPDQTARELDMKWIDPDGQVVSTGMGIKFVEFEEDSLVLKVTKLTPGDKGDYTCEATINGAQQQVMIYVQVNEKVEIVSPAEQPAIKGTDARIWCRTTTSSVKKKIKWYLKGQGTILRKLDNADKFIPGYETAAGKEGSYLLIKNVTLADSNVYVCLLELPELGDTVRLDINVIVTVPPKIMPIHLDPIAPKEGDRLVMSCKADGVPPPTYMFYKGNKALMEDRSTDGEFIIEDLKRSDEGVYICNAKNQGGSQNGSLTLDVKIPPKIESTENVTQGEGTEVRLPCVATGDPVPSMFWRRKGSQVDYLSEENSITDVFVEEVTDNPIQDGPSQMFRRTLYLVIRDLKPDHAGEYVCKADNQYGLKKRTFKIGVTYEPNFRNQEINMFYGWVGSKTNLTCIANGNPEPMITWSRGGQNLANENKYTVVNGESGISTRAISYLIPTVDSSNVGSVFGDYKCEAGNKFGTSSQTLVFTLAVVPEMAGVSVVSSKATEMILSIFPPANNGGQPVKSYLVKHRPADSSEDPETQSVNRFPEESSTKVTLTDLTPKTKYSIKVYAINNVGQGQEKSILESTRDISRPDPVVVLSSREGLTANEFQLVWNVPMTGGAPITNYVIIYSEALDVDTDSDPWKAVRVSEDTVERNVVGQENTQVMLTGLKKETYYKVTVSAVNRMGTSDLATFIFRTGRGVGPSGGSSYVRASVAGMLLVVMVTASLPPLL